MLATPFLLALATLHSVSAASVSLASRQYETPIGESPLRFLNSSRTTKLTFRSVFLQPSSSTLPLEELTLFRLLPDLVKE